MRGLWYLTIGCIVFVAITFFEQLPVIGWLGGILSIAAWIVISRALVGEKGFEFETPFTIGGPPPSWRYRLVGAFTAWLAQTAT